MSDEDFEALNVHKWHANQDGYAVRWAAKRLIFMHRAILGAETGRFIDHVDGNVLNNTRENLRFATHAENMRNRKIGKNNTSGLKGIYYRSARKKWQVEIKVNGRKISLGCYPTKEQAGRVYDAAAKLYHQEFAKTNQQIRAVE